MTQRQRYSRIFRNEINRICDALKHTQLCSYVPCSPIWPPIWTPTLGIGIRRSGVEARGSGVGGMEECLRMKYGRSQDTIKETARGVATYKHASE